MKEKNNISDNHEEELNNQPEQLSKYNISHLVAANRLKAYVRINVSDNEAIVNYEEILSYLKENGIVFGIKENEIRDYCNKREYSKELVAADGIEPIDGKNAELIYEFEIAKEQRFEEKEDGTIDFRNLNNIINVKKDDILCRIRPAQAGINGKDIYGHEIPYKPGKNVMFSYGKNTYVSENGLELKAGTDGCVKVVAEKIFVDDVYKVDNVDNETGNIDFNGSVIINGDVKAGFSVKAQNDIKIRGMVEGAYIEAGNDVVISKGMNGMGKGTIYAGGNITSKYIENAFIKSNKSIYAEALINSDVTASDSIILRGQSAVIIGGNTKANNTIYAKTIGNKTNTETNIIIDISKCLLAQAAYAKKLEKNAQLEIDLSNKYKELKDIDEKIDLIANSEYENKNVLHKHLIFKRLKVNNEIGEIKNQLTEDVQTDNIADHKIICKGIIYANTRITIGWMKYKVRQDISYSKIYNDGNDITITALLPSDLD